MDARLSKALDFSNFLETQNNQKQIFLKQFKENCVFYVNGHKFTASQQLISFLNSLTVLDEESIVILDDNNTPLVITDLDEFINQAIGTYLVASRKYAYDYHDIETNRSVEGLTNV